MYKVNIYKLIKLKAMKARSEAPVATEKVIRLENEYFLSNKKVMMAYAVRKQDF